MLLVQRLCRFCLGICRYVPLLLLTPMFQRLFFAGTSQEIIFQSKHVPWLLSFSTVPRANFTTKLPNMSRRKYFIRTKSANM